MIFTNVGKVEEIAPSLNDLYFDACLSDPPYGLDFMGKEWDHGVPSSFVWNIIQAKLKPGAYLLAFGGTRTYHRLACAIEDAGLNIRDSLSAFTQPDLNEFVSSLSETQLQLFYATIPSGVLSWIYSQGYPKAINIGKMIDNQAGVERPVIGRYQPPGTEKPWNLSKAKDDRSVEVFHSSRNNLDITAPVTDLAKLFDGHWGGGLKPAWEPIVVAQKPMDGSYMENAAKHGLAGFNIEKCRVESQLLPNSPGRFPANIIFDTESANFLDQQTGVLKSGMMAAGQQRTDGKDGGYQKGFPKTATQNGTYGDSGGASRFFYCAKSSTREKNLGLPDGVTNTHPTVKPLRLCEYLARLILPPPHQDGSPRRILVPYSGSMSEAIGAMLAGWDEIVCIEQDKEYQSIGDSRFAFWKAEKQKQSGVIFDFDKCGKKPASKKKTTSESGSLFDSVEGVR